MFWRCTVLYCIINLSIWIVTHGFKIVRYHFFNKWRKSCFWLPSQQFFSLACVAWINAIKETQFMKSTESVPSRVSTSAGLKYLSEILTRTSPVWLSLPISSIPCPSHFISTSISLNYIWNSGSGNIILIILYYLNAASTKWRTE